MRLGSGYRIERRLADGGMATVYLGVDERRGTPVAIKCLHEIYANNPVVRARFIDEGRIQMILQHPNILRVFELIEQPVLAFVMEFIEGGTLEDMLVERGPLDLRTMLEVIVPVLSGLGLAHSKGIIHRDLKPSNLLIQKLGPILRPKIMDFGVAKMNRQRELTATGTTVGTLHYMSPEQIVGSKKIDGRADIYSMGITIYKLVTGEVPFNASTEFALMMAQVEAPPTPPRRLNPSITPELEAVILKALRKRPAERYQSIKEFTEALVNLMGEERTQTLEAIRVPQELLQFALMANEVAVDRTEEVSLGELSSLPNMPSAFDHAATMLEDSEGSATVELRRDDYTHQAPADEQDLRKTTEDNNESEETMLLMPLRPGDAQEAPTSPRRSPHDTDTVEERPLSQSTQPDDDDLVATREARPLLRKPDLDSTRADRPSAMVSGTPQHLLRSSGQYLPQGPDDSPRSFGPAYVDSREQTRPKMHQEDFARALRLNNSSLEQPMDPTQPRAPKVARIPANPTLPSQPTVSRQHPQQGHHPQPYSPQQQPPQLIPQPAAPHPIDHFIDSIPTLHDGLIDLTVMQRRVVVIAAATFIAVLVIASIYLMMT
jgi:serine/threonine protein kinase